jgi:hypothetical protein
MLIYKFELREISHPSSTVPSLNIEASLKNVQAVTQKSLEE